MAQVSEATSLAWMTVEDVAEHFKVPPATVRDWRARGKGPQGVRIGRHVRYRRSVVEAWASEQEAQAARDPELPDFNAPVRPARGTPERGR